LSKVGENQTECEDEPRSSAPSISRRLTLVMAASCGVCVSNIYYNQPLLGIIQSSFPGRRAIAAMVPTATQLGYAAGLLLLVPLGDRIERRRLILVQTVLLVLALAMTAAAPTAGALVLGSVFVGLTSTVAQQILPFAAELASPEFRGRTIGAVMSGLLCGILLSRAVGGAVGETFGWRAMYCLGLASTALTGVVLAFALPRSRPKTQIRYSALLQSLVKLWRDEPDLRRSTISQACLFGSFIAFWSVLSLQLEAAYDLGATVAGMFGLVGAVGVLFAPVAGRTADRRGPHLLIGASCLMMVLSWVILGAWRSIAGLVVGVLLVDIGQQGSMISNQYIIYALRPEARNRINTVYMCGMFLGGSIGAAGAGLAWEWSGWAAVCSFGGVLAALALAVQSAGRTPGRRPRRGDA